MNKLKLSTQLVIGFTLLTLLIVVLGVTAWWRVNAISQANHLAIEDRYVKVKRFVKLRENNLIVARATRDLFLATDPAKVAALKEEIAATSKSTLAELDILKSTLSTAKGKALFEQLNSAREDYKGARDRVMKQLAAGNKDEAYRLLEEDLAPRHAKYMEAVQTLITLGDQLMNMAKAQADDQVATTHEVVLGLVLLSVTLAVFGAWWIIHATTQPLHHAVKVARGVASGDLTEPIHIEGDSEVAQLLMALKDMQQHLSGVVGRVRQNAEGVALASSEIASGNADLSSRTEHQASALQQTAASMEELGTTVRGNADNAQVANQLSIEAQAVAQRGGQAMQDVVDTMKSISDSSRRIADIIGVIDGIAFQTNILALNAAVEAARAGEQGRGFAVVAGEVRSLAQRSSEAAKEIRTLITQSTERVDTGTQQVDSAGATIQDVVRSISRVADIVGEISSASREQSAGVAQVGEAVSSMDQATQQNAALVQQSASAAENLRHQADELVAAMAVFKLPAGLHRAMA